MRFFEQVGELHVDAEEVRLPLNEEYALQIEALEPWCLRIALLPSEGLAIDRTWMVAPTGDTPWKGRSRLARTGFSGVGPIAVGEEVLAAGDFRVGIQRVPLALTVEVTDSAGMWRTLLADRPTGAYALTRAGRQTRHYQRRSRNTRHFGLGDKSGPLDRSGRRFRCLQIDALGYDAEHSDPLYKHVPFFIAEDLEAGGAVGFLYDTLSEITFDLGAEHSNYHPLYRYVEAEEQGLVIYILAGPRVRDVVRQLFALTGRPYFPPRWSLGFAFTSMHHADDPHAQTVIEAFARRCRAEQIPISAIHSGSGYTTGEDGRRYVFTWNATKFPERAAFFQSLQSLGFHTAANVKPTLLTTHPAYAESARAGRFVLREDGAPAVEQFWGGLGSSLDFTNPETIRWWQTQATEQVLEAGFDAIWNDNNEAEIADEGAWLHGFGTPLPALDLRPLQALLMTRASVEATRTHAPTLRPYSITRAGPLGIQRYAETWTGDNRTSWHTLKWNLRNGLSMGLSAMPLVGHDVGGFDGPSPDAELLVRWVQMMALHPRCVMNSWKPHGLPNLPWMHGEATELVRAALRLRYRFMPLLYNLVYQAHREGGAVIAPTFYHFDDPACRTDEDVFMLGPDVLVAPVVAPGARAVTCYLPEVVGGWHNLATGECYPGGQHTVLPAPLDCLPILVRNGAILPQAAAWHDRSPHDPTALIFLVFISSANDRATTRFFWDDGITQNGAHAWLTLDARLSEDELVVTTSVEGHGDLLPPYRVEAFEGKVGGE